MVSALAVMLILGLLQLTLALHVRNTLIDAAAEGARYAALADRNPGAGVVRTAELIRLALGSDYADEISAGVDGPMVRVTVVAHIPLLGFLGVGRGLEVSGHAIRETIRGG